MTGVGRSLKNWVLNSSRGFEVLGKYPDLLKDVQVYVRTYYRNSINFLQPDFDAGDWNLLPNQFSAF